MRLLSGVLTAILLSAAPGCAADRSLVFLFGPTSTEQGPPAARAAAVVAKSWLQGAPSTVELRLAGSTDTQEFVRAMRVEDIEKAFLFAAQDGRQSAMKSLLNGFDRASFSAQHHPGPRLVVAILDPPAFDDSARTRIEGTADFCRQNSIRVIVVDLSNKTSGAAQESLAALAKGTGGLLLHDVEELGKSVDTLFPVQPPPVETSTASKPEIPGMLAVNTRFVRTLSARLLASGSGFATTHGFAIAQTPLSAIEFTTNGGSYAARVRLTETIRNASGKAVWQAKKELQVKGPSARLEMRRKGELSFMREIQLPAGQYTMEAAVDDLISGKSAQTSQPLLATDTAPGLNVSDPVLVRHMDNSLDQFESDTTLAFDGKALAPLLNPPFRAGEPIELQIYFVLYPDLRGAQPQLSLDIIHGKQAVAHSQLAFNEKIRNTSTEGSQLDARGDQHDQFPYLADVPGVLLNEGDYEARITVRQDKQSVTRSIGFHVAGSGR